MITHFFAGGVSAMDDKFVREPEVIRISSLSRDTIKRLEQKDLFPRRLKVGGSVVWRYSELMKWIEEQK